MTNISYQSSDSLITLYDEIRDELGFGIGMSSLIANRAVWKTDVVVSLKRAYLHLVRAESSALSHTQKIDQILHADLFLRDLIEHLQGEHTEFHTENTPTAQIRPAKWYRTSLRTDSFAFGDSALNEHNEYTEAQHCRFTRNGADIKVIVDHLSETNFFADISYDLHSSGLFVATYDILDVGTPLNVRLVLPRRHSFQLQGTVSWVREPDNCAEDVSPGMGITFRKLSSEPSMAIRQFMSERAPLLFEVA